jgi:hypothetical protein
MQKGMSALPPIATAKADIDDMHVGTGDFAAWVCGPLKATHPRDVILH